ncbi:MAG TPA: response regulator [Candidatus Baltobacteraceae bacterium]|jgi:DNA-binding NarL/FixJ family response regulator
MDSRGPRKKTYVIERLSVVVPYLTSILSSADLDVMRVTEYVDYSYMHRTAPDVVFADIDFFRNDAPSTIRKMRRQSPQSLICVYTSQMAASWAKLCHVAGANAVLTKLSTDSELLVAVRSTLAVGAYTDGRYLGDDGDAAATWR